MKTRLKRLLPIVLAVLLLTMAAFAGTNANSAYKDFKMLFKENKATDQRGSADIALQLTDNGQTVFSAAGTVVGDKLSKVVSGNFNVVIDEQSKALQFYGEDGKLYLLDQADNAVYIGQKSQGRCDKMSEHDDERDFDQHSEAIVDYFLKDIQKDFEYVEDQDGSTDIALTIDKAEMPVIINALFAKAAEDKGGEHEMEVSNSELANYPLVNFFKQLKDRQPALVDDVAVSQIYVLFDRDQANDFAGISVRLEMTGNDDNGAAHTVVLSAKMSCNPDVQQAIEKISTEGRTIYELPDQQSEH